MSMASAAPSLQISSFLPRFRRVIMFVAPIAASFSGPMRFTFSSYSRRYARPVRWPSALQDGTPSIANQGNVRKHQRLFCSCCFNDPNANARDEGHQSIIGVEGLVKEMFLDESNFKSVRELFEASMKEGAKSSNEPTESGKDDVSYNAGIGKPSPSSGSDENSTSVTFMKEKKQLLSESKTESVLDSKLGAVKKGSHQITWIIKKKSKPVNLLSTVGNNPVSQFSPWFPYTDEFVLSNDRTLASADILEVLGPFLLDGRRQKFAKVVANRTYSVSLVVEGLDDLGNISAVLRSADALGFQSVHVISTDTKKRFKQKRNVSVGAEKWLDVEVWDSTKQCTDALRARGYRIATTSISADTVSILEMDWTVPTAVVFGNELKGISDEAMLLSDMQCGIPMIGMVDSFNVSVAAGILMYHAVHDRIARTGKHGDLNATEQKILTADFYLRHKSHASSVLDHLVAQRQSGQCMSLPS